MENISNTKVNEEKADLDPKRRHLEGDERDENLLERNTKDGTIDNDEGNSEQNVDYPGKLEKDSLNQNLLDQNVESGVKGESKTRQEVVEQTLPSMEDKINSNTRKEPSPKTNVKTSLKDKIFESVVNNQKEIIVEPSSGVKKMPSHEIKTQGKHALSALIAKQERVKTETNKNLLHNKLQVSSQTEQVNNAPNTNNISATNGDDLSVQSSSEERAKPNKDHYNLQPQNIKGKNDKIRLPNQDNKKLNSEQVGLLNTPTKPEVSSSKEDSQSKVVVSDVVQIDGETKKDQTAEKAKLDAPKPNLSKDEGKHKEVKINPKHPKRKFNNPNSKIAQVIDSERKEDLPAKTEADKNVKIKENFTHHHSSPQNEKMEVSTMKTSLNIKNKDSGRDQILQQHPTISQKKNTPEKKKKKESSPKELIPADAREKSHKKENYFEEKEKFETFQEKIKMENKNSIEKHVSENELNEETAKKFEKKTKSLPKPSRLQFIPTEDKIT